MTATQTATPSKTTTWEVDQRTTTSSRCETFDDRDHAWSFGDVTGTVIVAGDDLGATAQRARRGVHPCGVSDLKASHGVVVNTASLNALLGFKTLGSLAQMTAKAGIIAMMRQLAIRAAGAPPPAVLGEASRGPSGSSH
jgi:NAD(P)-dependent dehydrogenase (short-subunit alcohol dehydrogenase family)